MTKAIGYAAKHSISELRPMEIERRGLGPRDIAIDVMFCGVCHSDVHQVKNEWHNTVYPCMPGHEIVGKVSAVGAEAMKFKLGELVGVGCMVDSCGRCTSCKDGLEQYCEPGATMTYNGNARTPAPENNTFGGYSSSIVVKESFVLRMPTNLDPAAAAPLLCAGITTYSPMKHWKVGKGTKVGVVGLGGLGQLATKLAIALGADVTMISRSADKRGTATRLGAKVFVLSTSDQAMKEQERSLDIILSTIPTTHDANHYMPLLKRDGIYTVIGCLLPLKLPLMMNGMIMDRRSLGSTLIGSIAETQEVLDFCGKHGIVSDMKLIPVDEINDAYAKVDKGEVDYRFVIDMATIKDKKPDTSLAAKVGL